MTPRDTDRAAAAAQIAAWRALTPAQRVELAARMADEARDLVRGGIRTRHPGYSADEVERALLRILYGDDLVQRVWPSLPLVAP